MKEPLDYDLLEKDIPHPMLFIFIVLLCLCESIHILINTITIINLYNSIEIELLPILITIVAQFILTGAWFIISKLNNEYKKVLIFHISASVLFLILYLSLI